jgi:hypothetical protein
MTPRHGIGEKFSRFGGRQRVDQCGITRWRDADRVQSWVASASLLTEKHFRHIDGHTDLWALAAFSAEQISGSLNFSKERVA